MLCLIGFELYSRWVPLPFVESATCQIGINSANLATFSWWTHLQPLHFPAGIFSFIVVRISDKIYHVIFSPRVLISV